MSCLVRSRRPNGVVYVYRSVSVWDSTRKMSIPKRTLIGREDPETGEIVPTGKRGRRKKDEEPVRDQAVSEDISPEIGNLIEEARKVTDTISDQQSRYHAVVKQVRDDLVTMQTLKVELKKSEAVLDSLIKAIEPLV